jgi:hypothetical protein
MGYFSYERDAKKVFKRSRMVSNNILNIEINVRENRRGKMRL